MFQPERLSHQIKLPQKLWIYILDLDKCFLALSGSDSTVGFHSYPKSKMHNFVIYHRL